MTVGEVIRLRATYQSGISVVADGSEDGYDDVSSGQIASVKMALNSAKHRWGERHREPNGPPRSSQSALLWSKGWSCGACRIEREWRQS